MATQINGRPFRATKEAKQSSFWLHKIPFCLRAIRSDFYLSYHPWRNRGALLQGSTVNQVVKELDFLAV